MVFSNRMRLVGIGELVTKKGNKYTKLVFTQGADPFECITSESGYDKAKLYEEYEVTVSWNNQYKRLNFEGMKPVIR